MKVMESSGHAFPRQVIGDSMRLQGALREVLTARDAASVHERPYFDGLAHQIRSHIQQALRLERPGPRTATVATHSGVRQLSALLDSRPLLAGLGVDPVAQLLTLDAHLRQRCADAQYRLLLDDESLDFISRSYRHAGVNTLDITLHASWERARIKRDSRLADFDSATGAYEVFGTACAQLTEQFRSLADEVADARVKAVADFQSAVTHQHMAVPAPMDVMSTWQTFLILHTPSL